MYGSGDESKEERDSRKRRRNVSDRWMLVGALDDGMLILQEQEAASAVAACLLCSFLSPTSLIHSRNIRMHNKQAYRRDAILTLQCFCQQLVVLFVMAPSESAMDAAQDIVSFLDTYCTSRKC
jgi:hypothetical protein